MATYTQIQTRAQAWAMSENATDAPLYANDAYREVVRRLKLNPLSVTKTLVAGDWEYSIASDWSISNLVGIDAIAYSPPGASFTSLLEPLSAETIIAQQTSASSIRGAVREYALRGVDTVLFYPAPQGSDSITLYYQAAPTAMSAGSDTPSLIPSDFHDVVTLGCAAKLAEEEDSRLASELAGKFENRLFQVKGLLEEAESALGKRVTVGYPWRARWRRSDRSQYWSGG